MRSDDLITNPPPRPRADGRPASLRMDRPILIVDDEDAVLRPYSGLLRKAGYSVEVARSSREALSRFRARPPRVALIDVHLGGGSDGRELAASLLASSRRPLAILLMSGVHVTEADRSAGYAAGAVEYLLKPVLAEDLVEAVELHTAEPNPTLRLPDRASASGAVGDVLVVEDDAEQLDMLCWHLESEGFVPYGTSSAREAVAWAARILPEAVILDLRLPDGSGSDVLRCLRAHPLARAAKFLVWTGESERNPGLELRCMKDGANGYLVKGVNDVRALPLHLKRLLGLEVDSAGHAIRAAGALSINLTLRKVLVDGAETDLTRTEFALLSRLVRRSPHVVEWNELEREIWNLPPELCPESRAAKTVGVHLTNLRRKLGRAASCIVTCKRVGLRFDPSKA